jgi:multidrug efflux pump subunit AcrA (membrane-fusion protein)
MALVKVQNNVKKENTGTKEADMRSDVMPSAQQMDLIGVQKHKVEKMDLIARIPISGRVISSGSIAFQIYETDLRYIKRGLRFRGESGLYPENEISGIISSVDSVIDPTSRTIRVIGTIQKGAQGLISETSFSGFIEYTLKDRVAIPESAVLHTGYGNLVYLMNDSGQLTAKKVVLGLKTESFYEVVSGLDVNDQISSGPNFLIDSEAKIRGASELMPGQTKAPDPSCPTDQHWDTPMAMCMPGKASK